MIKAILIAGLFSVLALGGNARADTLFAFTGGSDFGYTVNGQFTVSDPNQNSISLVTSAFGEVTLGLSMTPITGVSGSIFQNSLNSDPNGYGITFTFAQGSIEFDHPNGSPHEFSTLFDTSGNVIRSGFGFIESPAFVPQAPLPASAPLFGLALLVLAALGFASKRLKPPITADGPIPC